jgi:hypothetical protein
MDDDQWRRSNAKRRLQAGREEAWFRLLCFVFGSIASLVLLVLMMHVSWYWWEKRHGRV